MSHHVLILGDEHHLTFVEEKRNELEQQEKSCTFLSVDRFVPLELEKILLKQPLCTKLIILTEAERAVMIKNIALQLGFPPEDICVIESECPGVRVFCSQCHHIQIVYFHVSFPCRNCHQTIEPSNHYSNYHASYLAYPVVEKG